MSRRLRENEEPQYSCTDEIVWMTCPDLVDYAIKIRNPFAMRNVFLSVRTIHKPRQLGMSTTNQSTSENFEILLAKVDTSFNIRDPVPYRRNQGISDVLRPYRTVQNQALKKTVSITFRTRSPL